MEKINFKMSPYVIELWETLNRDGYETRVVGGAVRDILLGLDPKDYDFCTTATPDQMIEFADEYSYRIEPTGLEHGTISFIIDSEAYEFTTLRIDTNTDGRHADVEFTTDFEKDAARRDFTINALSADIDGFVYDYFGGIQDLKDNTIRFVGNTEERIQEDYLRILRYFRFASRIPNSWEKMTDADLALFRSRKAHQGLAKISKERIWQEMSKLFTAPYSEQIAAVMEHEGVAAFIGLPKMTHAFSWRDRDAVSVVASYWIGKPDSCEDFCKSWKMSNYDTDKATFIARHSDITCRVTVENLLVNGVPREVVANACQDTSIRTHAETWKIPTMPVKGQDLLDAGMKQGKEVGAVLTRMRSAWIDSRFTASKETLMQMIK